ncbi:MAG: GGDEF domain-containing protein [Lachnospiraceae bacterium]|nr:GGDEF domain-containing protein [Lachnospiraceae bacterium]
MNIRNLKGYVAFFTSITLAVLVLLCALNEKPENIRIQLAMVSDTAVEWQVAGCEDKDFPVILRDMEGKAIEISGTLPSKIEDNYGLMMNTVFSKCIIKVDGNKIASFAEDITDVKGKMVGDVRLIVPITPDMAGKEIAISIMPYHSIRLNVEKPVFGNLDSLRGSIVHKNQIHFLIIIFMLAIMILSICFMLYQAKKGNKKIVPINGYFIGIVFFATLWIFCNSDIPQFISNRTQTFCIVGTLALSMIGIPYMGYFSYVIKRETSFFKVMELIGWLCPIVVIIGYVTDIYAPIDVLGFTHLYIVVAGIGSFAYAILEQKGGDFRKRLVLMESITMIVTAFLSLVSYIASPSGRSFTVVGGVGLFVFVAEILSLLVYDETNYIKERKYLDTYEEITYKDVLTGIENRVSFDKKLDELKESAKGKYETLILFDLDCLREVNDNYGFDEGDAYIVDFAECLKKIYEPKGDYFRLGGDEFAALIPGNDFDPDESIDELLKEVNYFNRIKKRSLSFISGWIQKEITDDLNFKRDFYRLADQSLCAMKIRQSFAKSEDFKEE